VLPRAASLALLVALAAVPAAAQTLYKWTDANGKVQYSDRLPKGFTGEVTRIEIESDKTTLPPAAVPPAAAGKPADVASPPAEDIAAKRRATRARLEARLARARDSLDAAKKALSDSESPEPEERQIVQQRATSGGMHGMTARSNCSQEKDSNGNTIVMCPTAVPGPEYHERVAKLEEDLRRAEEELSAAEQAWRRGVD
jgi:hypothetical protein